MTIDKVTKERGNITKVPRGRAPRSGRWLGKHLQRRLTTTTKTEVKVIRAPVRAEAGSQLTYSLWAISPISDFSEEQQEAAEECSTEVIWYCLQFSNAHEGCVDENILQEAGTAGRWAEGTCNDPNEKSWWKQWKRQDSGYMLKVAVIRFADGMNWD